MAQIKLLNTLSLDVSATKKAGNALNEEYSSVTSDEVDTLATATEYIKQHKEIKALLDLYNALVQKDMKDISAMITTFEQFDFTTASTYKG